MKDQVLKTDKLLRKMITAVGTFARSKKTDQEPIEKPRSPDRWHYVLLLYVNLERMIQDSTLEMIQARAIHRFQDTGLDETLLGKLISLVKNSTDAHELKFLIGFVLKKKNNLSLDHIQRLHQLLEHKQLSPSVKEVHDESLTVDEALMADNRETLKRILQYVGRDLGDWPDELPVLHSNFTNILGLFKDNKAFSRSGMGRAEIKNRLLVILQQIEEFHKIKESMQIIDFKGLDNPEENVEVKEALHLYDDLAENVKQFEKLTDEQKEDLKERVVALELLYEQIKFELESEVISIEDYELMTQTTKTSVSSEDFSGLVHERAKPVEKVISSRSFPSRLTSNFLFKVEPFKHTKATDDKIQVQGKVVYFWPVSGNVNDNIPIILKVNEDNVEGVIFLPDHKRVDKILQLQPKKGKTIIPDVLLNVCVRKLIRGDFDTTLEKYFNELKT